MGVDVFQSNAIYEAIVKHTALRHLVLSDNNLSRDSAETVGRLLRDAPHLRSLNLANNDFWDSGVRVIARHLDSNTGLLSLRMERNRIGRGAIDLIQACQRGKDKMSLRCSIGNGFCRISNIC